MNTIELLVTEHKNIIRMLGVMKNACLNFMEHNAMDIRDFYKFITFIRCYADKNHHGKEELFLFKEMQDRLGSAAQTLVKNGMLVEHDLARLYVKQLENALRAYEADKSSENKLDIISNAMAYSNLLHRHIEREDGAVYPFAKRGLSADVFVMLDHKTSEFERSNSKENNEQLALLASLEEKYKDINKIREITEAKV